MNTKENLRYFNNAIADQYNVLLKYVTTITKDSDLADDIVQDTMETVWRKLDLVRKYKDLKRILFTIAKNKLMDHYRKSKADLKAVPFIEEIYFGKSIKDSENSLIVNEERRRIFSMLGRLREDYSMIILLHYYYGFSLREVAEITNKNYNTVVSWHSRALQHLGKLIKNKYW